MLKLGLKVVIFYKLNPMLLCFRYSIEKKISSQTIISEVPICKNLECP